MADEPLDFTREYLRRMDEKLDRVLVRMDELSSSISGLLQIAAAQSSHLNRLDQRVERIEKRLSLVDA
jgi:archaellum component FlaC